MGGIMTTEDISSKGRTPKQIAAIRVFIVPLAILCIFLYILLLQMNNIIYAIIGLIWIIIWLAVLVIASYLKWGGDRLRDDEGFINGDKFCEQNEEGDGRQILQPINTWSDLAFIAAGIGVLGIASSSTGTLSMSNPDSWIPLAYALVVMFMGPGSMLYHASGKRWGGWFDNLSMVAWVSFNLSFTLTRLLTLNRGWDPNLLLPMAGGLIICIGAGTAYKGIRRTLSSEETVESGLGVIAFITVVWLFIEALVILSLLFDVNWGFSVPQREWTWFFLAWIPIVAAFACWIAEVGRWEFLGSGGKPLWCHRESWFQAHGFWHIFSAIATVLVYLYFASEI